MRTNEQWTRRIGARTVHSDSEEHVTLVTRTLGIDEHAWATVLDHYADHVTPDSSVEARLSRLSEAFRAVAPYATRLPDLATTSCVCCGEPRVQAAVARHAGDASLVYGRCAACGHGQLLSGASAAPYATANYYQRRGHDGTGYADYQGEREYREAKAARLFDWVERAGVKGKSLLEVGSGFGYTRKAAEDRSLRSAGVDVNPEAARVAYALYGFETHVSTLADALASGALTSSSWDVVLYQFVLEHVLDPRAELAQATSALTPGGHLLLIVPSMSTFELDVFGASYRSLRGDHLHLFSEPSLRRYLSDVGLAFVRMQSHCSLDLLRGFLTPAELNQLYDSGQGPDLTLLAKRTDS